MMNSSFLHRLAQAYYTHFLDLLPDTLFVFPNKRSGAFFRKALHDVSAGELFIEPETLTIAEFVDSLSDFTTANRFELLTTLYDEYRSLSPEVEDFDRFVFWGDMLLKDFNDVDQYMADPHELFANIRNLREISTDYLTDEQRAVIEEYWNVTLPMADPDTFWQHISHAEEDVNHTTRDKFLSLWEILYPLYRNFNLALNRRGLTYSGQQYREVAKKLRDAGCSGNVLDSRRVVMVGFNILSIAETKIFESLHSLGIGDYYWETDFPSELANTNTTALRFIRQYRKKFPSLVDIDRTDAPMPQIEIVSVPSSIGQTKYVATLLDKMSSGANPVISHPGNAIDTAIVLPSEELFIDMLHSIPSQFAGGVNVTMGLPLRMTTVAMLIGSVTRLHQRATMVRGSWHFFYEDVCDVLSNPLLNSILPDECNSLRNELETRRMFTIPTVFIAENFPSLADVFYGVDDLREAQPVFDYSLRLLDFVERLLPERNNKTANIERGFLLRYRQALQSLLESLNAHGITMKESTFFALIEKAISSETASFKGEPLRGLQIMGVLETRTLDFDNVIILSMNDRVYPRRHWSNSFIPETLRRAYGVSTSDIQESMSAYYFYRLISAAKRVTLVYDARTEAGDPSRYIHQLQFNLSPGQIIQHHYAYSIAPGHAVSDYAIIKTPDIMERINRYRTTGTGSKSLSASSINTYLSCPLHFYFSNIQELKVQDEIVDYIDFSDYGHILHTAAENIYKSYRGSSNCFTVTTEVLDAILDSPTLIPSEVTNAINKEWNRLDNKHPDAKGHKDDPYLNQTPLTGEALIVHGLIVKTLRKMFKLEKGLTPFEFIEGEMELKVRLEITPSLTINLIGYIDRVDRLPDGTIRLIDYKTGNDSTELQSIDNTFNATSSSSPNKAVRQLFIYANAYAKKHHYDGPIQPIIYKLKSVATQSALSPITIGEQPLTDYREYNAEMMTLLGERLAPLFDPDVPITPSPDPEHCCYCNFKLLCGLAKERKY